MDRIFGRRIVALFWVFILVFGGLGIHLAYIQIFLGPKLSKQALTQQTQSVSLEIPPRGQILDRNLKPLVAYSEASRIVVFPAAVTEVEKAAGIISNLLDMDYQRVFTYLRGRPKIIPYDLNKNQENEFRKLKLPGIIVSKVKTRSRLQEQASHILGYTGVGKKGSQFSGLTGIESYYDVELTGVYPESRVSIFLDGKGQYISGLRYNIENNRQDKARKNVVLTIDRQVQEIVEQVVDNAGISDGAVVVMDVKTGDIVAMTSRPRFHLGNTDKVNSAVYSSVYSEVKSDGEEKANSFINHALSRYQPGSVFKVVTAAAALEEKVVFPETVFLCAGEKDSIVRCYDKKGHGILTFAEAVAVSCNPTFARVGLKLGAATLVEYAKRFGLGETEIIGYKKIGSQAGLERINQDYNLVNASIGQWPVETSVLQITAMMNTVANNGVNLKPRLVREVTDYQGRVIKIFEEDSGKRVISRNTAYILRQMLESVTRTGTGKQAWVADGGSAGKTGSAQTGQEKIDAWFSGYAPVSSPRYTVTVLVNDGESGGRTAAPVFREIMQNLNRFYQ